eukprot:9006589-Karenia_brevis.AAC.1
MNRGMVSTACQRGEGTEICGLRLGDVIGARASLSCGTAGGKDGIVSEVLKKAPFAILIIAWLFFKLRSEYGVGRVSDAWRTWCLTGLPKTRLPLSYGDFRYI